MNVSISRCIRLNAYKCLSGISAMWLFVCVYAPHIFVNSGDNLCVQQQHRYTLHFEHQVNLWVSDLSSFECKLLSCIRYWKSWIANVVMLITAHSCHSLYFIILYLFPGYFGWHCAFFEDQNTKLCHITQNKQRTLHTHIHTHIPFPCT